MRPLGHTTIAIVVLVAGSASAVATTGGAIGHDQAFVGRVNGSCHRATISMACFGPVYPGKTAHPRPG